MNTPRETLFIILPVLLAGVTFIIILKLELSKKFAYPLDAGIKWRGKRIFGANKTVRGPSIMGLFTMIYGFAFHRLWGSELSINLTDRQALIYFLAVGIAYSFGELPNSFIKRRLSIPPGETAQIGARSYVFKLLDTFDSLIACGFVYLSLFHFAVLIVLAAVVVGGILHLLTDQLMQFWHLK